MWIFTKRVGRKKEVSRKAIFINVAISSCTLKSSCSWILHVNSINVIFFDGLNCFVLRMASYLDAFSTYPLMRSCTACHLTTVRPEASEYRSSRTRYSFHSNNNTPSRYHTNCLAYISQHLFLFVLCGLYLHPLFLKEISVLPLY